jgi:hypothetical protein
MIMITIGRPEVGTSVVSSALLMLVIALSSAACASVRPNRAALLQFTSPPRSAAPLPGSWDKVEGLRVGFPLVVTLKSGDRFEGALKGLTRGGLTLTAPSGQEFQVPRSEVGSIVAKVKDGLTNGGLIGAGVGLDAAVVALAIAGSRDGYVLPSAKWGAPLLLSGAGSLGGMLVDRAHKRQQLVYVAP